MKNNTFILLVIIICIIIFANFLFILWYFSPYDDQYHNDRYHYIIAFNQTKIGGGYLLDISICWPDQIKPTELFCRISNKSNQILFRNDFPISNGKVQSKNDDNISITWFDNDYNHQLSIKDTIQIDTPFTDLVGYEFSVLIYQGYNYPIEIGSIILN